MSGYLILTIISGIVTILTAPTMFSENYMLMYISIIALYTCILSGSLWVMYKMVVRREIMRFNETKNMLVRVLNENRAGQENAGFSLAVVKANEWLTSAKANLKAYGIWSKYYGSGVNDLEYIIIKKGE